MNKIHETCIMDDRVELGVNNEILPYTVIYGPTKIGDNNIIGPHVVIGTPGEDTKNPRHQSHDRYIEIGDNNIIKEFTAIQKPCYEEITRIGNNVFLMHGVHVPHDTILHDEVVVTPLVVLGGISKVLKGANIGMGATIHQYSIIGQYSMVATGAAVVKNVKPFSRYIPGKPITVNDYALRKFGFEDSTDEISRYVLEDILPKQEELIRIIEEYNSWHLQSGRKQY
jgi:UDP-N-acetylglucosamine acyltransferase